MTDVPLRGEVGAAPVPLPVSRRLHLFGGAALGLFWLLFAAANVRASLRLDRPVGLGATVLELLTGVLFVVRRPPRLVSRSGLAWIAAPAGTFGFLLARPSLETIGAFVVAAPLLQVLGAAFAASSLLTLRRSFGLVAANRGLTTSGPYRLVRHPIYTGYLLVTTGYLLENPTIRNAAVYALVNCAQLLRIREEEALLSQDADYAAYRERVRYRLVPGLY
jgi:protein-S-isoprenylcysteine O-methyltransferase Ste14